MQIDVTVDGIESLRRKLRDFPELLEKEVETVIRQAGRTLAIEYGFNTVPWGMREEQAEAHGRRLEKESQWMFPTRENPVHLYRLLKQVDERMAKAYWALHKRGDQAGAERLLRKRGIPRGIREGEYESRRNAGGYVPYAAEPIAMAAPGRQESFIKKRKARIGLAKAGWLQAAQAIGGRVRRNGREAFPKYVRTIARRESGLGGARVIGRGRFVSVTIYTSVRYAERALPNDRYLKANDVAEERLAKSLRERLSHVRRRTFNGRKRAA